MAKLSNTTSNKYFIDLELEKNETRGAFCIYQTSTDLVVEALEEKEWEEVFEALAEGGNYFTSPIDGKEYIISFGGEKSWEDAIMPIYNLLCRGFTFGVWKIKKHKSVLSLGEALKLTSHLAIVRVYENEKLVETIDVSNYEHRDDADKYLDYEVVRIKPYAEVSNESKLWNDGALSVTINSKVMIIVEKGEQ